MNQNPELLWLSISPYLKCLDRRLLLQLAKVAPTRQWEYIQTVDEPCCVDSVVAALHEYVSDRATLERQSGNPDYKVHLLGHGVSGVVALLYARQYPERVASLTLLSVNVMPAVNWQAHYYALRRLLPCSRSIILAQMARILLGDRPTRLHKALARLLEKDLDSNLTLHSLGRCAKIPAGSPEVPLLICNGEHDSIVCGQSQMVWHDVMKPSDRLWQCPKGSHFFHFDCAQETARAITAHISSAAAPAQRQTEYEPIVFQPVAHN